MCTERRRVETAGRSNFRSAVPGQSPIKSKTISPKVDRQRAPRRPHGTLLLIDRCLSAPRCRKPAIARHWRRGRRAPLLLRALSRRARALRPSTVRARHEAQAHSTATRTSQSGSCTPPNKYSVAAALRMRCPVLKTAVLLGSQPRHRVARACVCLTCCLPQRVRRQGPSSVHYRRKT